MDDTCARKETKFPYPIVDLDNETSSELLENFEGTTSKFVQVGPQKQLLPKKYKETAGDYYNFVVRPDDVWVVTYPRSGTTWTQEMAWLLANNLNYKKAEVPLNRRFPFLEHSILFNPTFTEMIREKNKSSPEYLEILDYLSSPVFEMLEKTAERRFIKTHLALQFLPPSLLSSGAKVIYVARNPKNVAVSYYNFNKMNKLLGYYKDFPKFWDFFQRDLVMWSPYWSHIEAAWEKRHEKNLLFMFYEDMTKDLNKSVRKVAEFLGTQYSDEEFKILEKHISFDNMKNNQSINSRALAKMGVRESSGDFIREGKSGGVESYFEGALKIKADKWIAENLSKTDLRFPC